MSGDETIGEEEVAKRRDKAIRRALNTPPAPKKAAPKKATRASKARRSKPKAGEAS